MRLLLRFTFLIIATVAFTSHVKDIWSFPLGTWVENLAVRANGQIIVTTLNKPHVYQVDPTQHVPAYLVAEIPSKLDVVGITEMGPDLFYVNAGNFTTSAGGGRGTFSVYELDLHYYQPGGALVTPRLVADVPEAGQLNGNTVLDGERRTLLMADSVLGVVWRLNVATGQTSKILSDQLMAPLSKTNPLGINGLKVLEDTLYWTNSDQNLIAKAPINRYGEQRGASIVVVTNITTADDLFVLDNDRGIVASDNRVLSFGMGKSMVITMDGLVRGATAVRPAPHVGSYYVTTEGGAGQYFGGNLTVPGKVVQIFE